MESKPNPPPAWRGQWSPRPDRRERLPQPRNAEKPASYGARCVMVIAVPVIVKVAVRSAPVLGATANWTVPFPAPDAP
jgi:hypothetical protein